MERDACNACFRLPRSISTHALRVERDLQAAGIQSPALISTHALRVERDGNHSPPVKLLIYFNSRAPCGARRHKTDNRTACRQNFNSRAPCGARRLERVQGRDGRDFNSRAPCGARREDLTGLCGRFAFQLTRSVWSATLWRCGERWSAADFNSRAPCGARLFL